MEANNSSDLTDIAVASSLQKLANLPDDERTDMHDFLALSFGMVQQREEWRSGYSNDNESTQTP